MARLQIDGTCSLDYTTMGIRLYRGAVDSTDVDNSMDASRERRR